MNEPSQIIKIAPEFSDEHLLAISEAADVIACECPSYLVQLLKEVKEFRRYTGECIERFPDEADSHEWLISQTAQVEGLLSKIIYEFFQKENLIDENDQLNLEQLSERNRKIALKKVI